MPFFNPNLGLPHRRRLGPPWPYKPEWTLLGHPLVLVVVVVLGVLNVVARLLQMSMVFLLLILRRHLCLRSNNLNRFYGRNPYLVITHLPILTLELRITCLLQGSNNSRSLYRHPRSWVPLNGIQQYMVLGILKQMKQVIKVHQRRNGEDRLWAAPVIILLSTLCVPCRWQSFFPLDYAHPCLSISLPLTSLFFVDGYLLIMICFFWHCDWHHAACWQSANDARSSAIGGLILHRLRAQYTHWLTAFAFHLIFNT